MSEKKYKTVISIDCMGGDLGEQEVLKGIIKAYKENNSLFFIIHGAGKKLPQLLLKQKSLLNAYRYVEAGNIVSMSDKPSQALRKARNTTMWNALTSVSNGEAEVAISCGNTGALMAMSMMKLKKINGINRPAIAVLWPSTNSRGFNILLDAGADIRADAQDLCQYALMGVSYAKSGFNIKNPKVGILNIGTEEHKGSTELLKAADIINNLSSILGFKFIGYVEGDDIPSSKIDVIVTDGFTGNIALKTAEGTSNFIISELKKALSSSIIGKLSSLLNFKNLKDFKNKLDPRMYNGAILLGLDKPVIKSHGSTDSLGFANSLKVCEKTIKGNLIDKIKKNIILNEN